LYFNLASGAGRDADRLHLCRNCCGYSADCWKMFFFSWKLPLPAGPFRVGTVRAYEILKSCPSQIWLPRNGCTLEEVSVLVIRGYQVSFLWATNYEFAESQGCIYLCVAELLLPSQYTKKERKLWCKRTYLGCPLHQLTTKHRGASMPSFVKSVCTSSTASLLLSSIPIQRTRQPINRL